MKLHYQELGEGKPLIILHGLFGSSDNWMTIGKKLAENHKVYLVDQRNHGDSPHSDTHNYEVMATDLKEFIQEHKIENPHIIGHSMGGKTAMQFAVTNPDLYDKLIVVDIAPKAYPVHHDTILEGLKSINLTELNSRNDADKALAEYVPEKGVRQFLLKNLTRDENKNFVWKINLSVIEKSIEAISKGLEKHLSTEKDTLFIGGSESHYIKNEDHIVIINFFPNAKVEMIEGAGHWIHAEKPEEFLEVVMNFLR
ncbi:alpha/beta fold hydrolase [Marivirga sp. S37H4]|uniref:Alpha/beta fold hydrolase n=1 Tax=Marivirga aurantiaca TaxID=2802615 RepID=A0A935CBE1_9BACT|nr:alpha/beta fold hydrolase [Marivirga aurantiaca]MBK6267039.1 alpha/beta fold hydrolase [Marivirga aurantiaca]